jgi:hypothetical protein
MGTGGSRYGAGRPGWRVKAEHCLRLRAQDLKRHGVMQGTGYFGWHWTNSYSGEETGSIGITASAGSLRLNFSTSGTPVTQHVPLDRTPCHFGGTRVWLCCPRCSRRVGVLYLRGGNFVCRHCGRLAYASQSDDVMGSSWRRQHRLEARLGDNLTRPKGMHHRTHQKLMREIVQCWETRDLALVDFMARMNARLRKLGDDFGIDL